uniref:Uncharacterized protein n=1 Tax=Anguilla anguilla TaxID=7936 RepID=A0A0E9SWN1_ANGAN
MLRTCFSYYFGHFFVFPFLLKHSIYFCMRIFTHTCFGQTFLV